MPSLRVVGNGLHSTLQWTKGDSQGRFASSKPKHNFPISDKLHLPTQEIRNSRADDGASVVR